MRRRGLPTLGLVPALPPHPQGVYWQLAKLSVHAGPIFPTSTGAGPQLSMYAAVDRLAQGLATRLVGREVALA